MVAATLPLAVLITFLFMQGMGLSANLMSLGGLAIAIGLLVDGSIVVVENIVERLGRAHEEGTPRLTLVYQAASEVIVPVSAGIALIRSAARRVGDECVRTVRSRRAPET